MKQQRIQMGMPVTVVIEDAVTDAIFNQVFDYFDYVDNKFSTYKDSSEINAINNGSLRIKDSSADMQLVFSLAEKTKKDTDGYFDIFNGQIFDPSGLVKGWAIQNAAKILANLGVTNFYIDAGGDIQTSGRDWSVGIRHPLAKDKIVKKLKIKDLGVATSGTYERGQHVYNPKDHAPISEIVSLTVIGPNIYEADRMATAAFAMGKKGIIFIDLLKDFSGMMIDQRGQATYTRNFLNYA